MSGDLDVQVELSLKDNLSKAAGTALKSLAREARGAGAAVDAVGGDGVKQLTQDADAAARGMTAVGDAAQDAKRDVEAVSHAGKEAAAAFTAAESKGRRLGQILSRARDAGRDMARSVAGVGKGLAAVGGGLAAGGYVVKRALDKPVEYEDRLAGMANVAYADRDAAGRIAGMADLNATIVDAVRQGGGSREQAASALNTILAAGTDEATAKKLLPVVQKAAVASGSDADELAMILVKGVSQKQFTADEAQAAIDKAVAAGNAGQFELKDMARWLPQIIAAGRGMKGMAGYEAHLANLQGVANVAGGSDQAGNAYFNLLGKLTSPETARNFQRMGVNLSKELSDASLKGVDPVTAFVDLVQTRVVSKSKPYQALQAKIAATDDKDEKRALMEQAVDLLQGTAVGKVIQDREAMLGLVGVMSQRDVIGDVRQQLQHADGATDTAWQVMASTTGFKAQTALNEKDFAASRLFEEIKEPLDKAVTGISNFARASPELATASYGAATALSAVGAGGGAILAAKRLMPGGKSAADIAAADARAASKATLALIKSGPVEGGFMAQALRPGTAANLAGKAAVPLTVGMTALEVYQTESNPNLNREEKNVAHAETAGGLAGAWAGAKGGAIGGGAVGTAVPGLGNAAGAVFGGLIGALVGYFGGRALGRKAGEAVFEPDSQPQKIEIHVPLEVDGVVLAEVLEEVEARKAARR